MTTTASAPSPFRAWQAVVSLSLRRQARMRQTIWIALALLGLAVAFVILVRVRFGWGLHAQRSRAFRGANYAAIERYYTAAAEAIPFTPEAASLHRAATAAFSAGLESSATPTFTRLVVFSLFLGFLLPLLSLSFAADAIGGEREARTSVWLLSRPVPRWAVYLAKYVAILPWTLGLTLGGFALICLAAGPPGYTALRLYWPAVLMSSVTYAALFHLFGAYFRRPTVIALVYSFFLETLLGDMPGMMKRCSVVFYSRCLIYEQAAHVGLAPDKPSVYMPVSATTAWAVLALATVLLLGLGALAFARAEYGEDS